MRMKWETAYLADRRRGNDTMGGDLADEGSNKRNGSELVEHVG